MSERNTIKFVDSSIGIVFLLLMVLFPSLLYGAWKVPLPSLIPSPQRITWNGQRFCHGLNSDRFVKRLTANLSEVVWNPSEAYTLKVSSDSIILTALTQQGLFRGVQTLHQLTVTSETSTYVTGCSITDWPAFAIRGFMQDVGRNFMPLTLLKEQIDVMAAYKYNVFHLHFTDNPGWRLESKRYPQLHAASSMSRWPGQYYTQENFLDLIQYCGDRYITLIPEFDIPGHCESFRRAFSLDSMRDPKVQPILLDLIDELCSLVPKEKMPYLHLGTDEVWQKHEQPAPGLLNALIDRVRSHGREVIVWRPGQQIDDDQNSVTQLWSAGGKPKEGHPYIDSRLNYLNHLDPLAGVAQLYFDRICNKAHGDAMALGGILCCWNDNNVKNAADILVQNPVYPGLLTYSETSWKGQSFDSADNFLAKIPSKENPLFTEFQQFENRLTRHRDLYFKGKPFPYVRQTDIEWSLLGPFNNHGDVNQSFAVERNMAKSCTAQGKEFKWEGPVRGGTIHVKHFFGFPSYVSEKQGTIYAATNIWSPVDQETGCWIGFHDWSRSGGRRGGPFPVQGQWHNTNPKVWVNGTAVAPPVWNNPGLDAKSEEIPFSDENFSFRQPAKIHLKKGWNQVLLKVPQGGKSWKWMFTFVPVKFKRGVLKEVEGLKYSTNPQLDSDVFSLSPAFGEHMVFQQNNPIHLSGTAGVGDEISLKIANQSGNCVADVEGKWRLTLPQVPAGGPYSLQVSVNGKINVDWKDILVGEVWFCSGQSNMEFRLDQSENGKLAVSRADDNQMRMVNFHSIAATSDIAWDSLTLGRVQQLDYFEGSWQKDSPSAASGFSAIAYHFGKVLRAKLGVPVGLVEVAVGGAPVESFIDRTNIDANPELSNINANWFGNDLVMEWCRQRAVKNLSLGSNLLQKHPFFPGYVFEAGIYPFKDLPVRGIIWYQGESNAHNSSFYETALPELVRSLRTLWNSNELPFIFAQLSAIQRTGWEVFRDTQRRLAGKIDHAALVVTSDLGDSLNVHPIRKKEIGYRFALQALQKVYKKGVLADGPLPEKAKKVGGSVVEISFLPIQKLKTSDGETLRELEVCGKEGQFHTVPGLLAANKIVIKIKNKDVKMVRYGWKPYWRGNLVNQDGLPASTFCLIVN